MQHTPARFCLFKNLYVFNAHVPKTAHVEVVVQLNIHGAIEKVTAIASSGSRVVLEADILSFFDKIPHDVIMNLIRNRVADGNILDILEAFLTSGVMEDGKFIHTHAGAPQGGVISPLLANIVLDVLDRDRTSRGWCRFRSRRAANSIGSRPL